MCRGHPPSERRRRHKLPQARSGLISRIEQHAGRARTRRDINQHAGRETRDAIRVGVRDGDHTTPSIAARARASYCRVDQQADAAGACRAGKSDFHERRARGGERACRSLNVRFVSRIADRGRDEPRARDRRVNLAQHVHAHGTERAGERILRIDHVRATGKRS